MKECYCIYLGFDVTIKEWSIENSKQNKFPVKLRQDISTAVSLSRDSRKKTLFKRLNHVFLFFKHLKACLHCAYKIFHAKRTYVRWRCLPEVESSRTSLASRTSSRTHFQVLGLGLEASSPWLWPRSLRSSKIAQSSARGQHYFLNRWNFVGKRQKPRRKFANTFLFSAIGA